jgi:hypothetical protein
MNPGPMKATLVEQVRCVEREIQMRQRVYPGLVDRGRMTPNQAMRETEAMLGVLETLNQCMQLADCLEQVERIIGPEARVYVQIPDTLATQIAAQLRGVPHERPTEASPSPAIDGAARRRNGGGGA